jgi:hypothetical protein
MAHDCRQPFRYEPERPTTGKVRVARHPTGTMANQATRLGFGRFSRFSRGSFFVVVMAEAVPDQ